MKLKGKTALVLGSIKGIGKGIGLALARAGVNTTLTYHDWEESLPALKSDFAKIGSNHLVQKINLLKTDEIKGLIQTIVHHFGSLDILINNIERGGWPVVHGPYTQDQWDLEMETTLRAKQWVFEAAFPYLKSSPDAVVVTLSSIAGIVGRSGPAGLVFNEGYAAANRGISLLTETWARMGAPQVRVNEIMLGFIETRHGERTRGWNLLSNEQKQAVIDHTLVGRAGMVKDVVDAVMFLIEKAPFMTGAVLRLDGGYVLGGEPVGKMPEGVL